MPTWSDSWSIYATLPDAAFAAAGLLGCLLIILWWRQQSNQWLRVALATLLGATLLAIASYYLFVVPPHFAGCADGCDGWRGYPLRMALYTVEGENFISPADFALNIIILWLLWLVASVVWKLLATLFRLEDAGRRWRIVFVLAFAILPWGLLPRILNPPQPQVFGEDLRLANNARRAAEFTYGVTGILVHRLALEDVRRDTEVDTIDPATAGQIVNQVCLRGYTWFYLPWQRYRVGLDANGSTALRLDTVPLSGSCWEDSPQDSPPSTQR